MIGHQQKGEIAQGGQFSQHRTQYQLVDALKGFNLEIWPAHVASLIGRLNMKQQEVTGLERLKAVPGLRAIVRIEKTCRARDRYHVQGSQTAKSVDQVDRRNHRTVNAETRFEGRDSGAFALS